MMTALAALTDNTFVDLSENAAPGTPAADTARLYAFDDSGTTRVAYVDSASAITVLGTTATQAQMETATSTAVLTSPGRQHFHPGHPKAGGNLDGTGTPAFQSDYGMGAVTDNGVGNYTLAFDTAFSATTYWLTAWARFNDAASPCGLVSALSNTAKTTSAMTIRVGNSTTGATFIDSTEIGISFWGDYA